jgi:regulator of RNase E activity RraA
MKFITSIILITLGLNYACSLSAQTISREELVFLTSEWKGERFADGRPKIADNLLERAKVIGIDDAWTVLKNLGYLNQFEGGWKTVNDLIITGRAVTAMYMPSRPDVLKNIMERGAKEGRTGATNSWPIDKLTKGDLYVADSYGRIADGPIMGSTLGTSIYAKSGNGVIINGAARDIYGLMDIKGFNAFVRDWHPSFVTEMVLTGLNTPIRIGGAIVLPGDLVIGNRMGVLFVPAHLAEQVISTAEFVNKLDMFKFEMLKARTFTTGQMDSEWPDNLKIAFLDWLNNKHPELGRMTRPELDNMMKSRTW